MPQLETDELILNMGPQHPSTHGVLRLILKTDGEIVTDVRPVVGYLHRCAEKIGENVNYIQYVPYTDRLDYLSSMSDNLGFCLAVEKLGGIEVPERAQWIRVIMAELNRIASHLVALGTYGLDIGTFTPFLYAFREREMILNIFESASGARLTYNYVRIGGVMRDITPKTASLIKKFLSIIDDRIKEYNDLLTYNSIFIQRTAKLGIVSKELGFAYGLSGPMIRGSGVDFDIRKIEPYCVYDKFDFKTCLGTGEYGTIGDCWNRHIVRMNEMIESAKIIRQALDGLPSGKFWDEKYQKRSPKIPKGEIYFRIENPRGELGYYIISDGTEKPARVKIRAPSFVNLSVLPEISKGVMIADLVAILGSIDIVLGEVDR